MENQKPEVVGGGSGTKWWVYGLILVVVLGLVAAGGYWYASRQTVSVTFEEETPTTVGEVQPTNGPVMATYTMEELDKVKDSQSVVRGENISMAGMVRAVEGNAVDVERYGELVKLTLGPETKIFIVDVTDLEAVEVDDYGIRSDPANSSEQPREGQASDILPGAKAQVFFGRKDAAETFVTAIWVYQER